VVELLRPWVGRDARLGDFIEWVVGIVGKWLRIVGLAGSKVVMVYLKIGL
jgi:hypothetical protein